MRETVLTFPRSSFRWPCSRNHQSLLYRSHPIVYSIFCFALTSSASCRRLHRLFLSWCQSGRLFTIHRCLAAVTTNSITLSLFNASLNLTHIRPIFVRRVDVISLPNSYMTTVVITGHYKVTMPHLLYLFHQQSLPLSFVSSYPTYLSISLSSFAHQQPRFVASLSVTSYYLALLCFAYDLFCYLLRTISVL